MGTTFASSKETNLWKITMRQKSKPTQNYSLPIHEQISPINSPLYSEKIICGIYLIGCLPIILLHCLYLLIRNEPLLKSVSFQVDDVRLITLKQFNNSLPGKTIPYLLSIISGDLSLVGAKRYKNYAQRCENLPPNPNWSTPGLFSILDAWYWVGLNTNNSERQYAHYLRTNTLCEKLSLLLKIAINYLIYNNSNLLSCSKFKIFNIKINNVNQKQCIESIIHYATLPITFPAVVNFVNANNLNIAFTHNTYQTLLQRSDMVLSDGSGVRCACMIKHVLLKDNLNGTDLFAPLCEKLEAQQLKPFFLGATQVNLDAMISHLKQDFPNLNIAGFHHGHFDPTYTQAIIDQINASNADFVFVGMGSPIQEQWIDENKAKLHCKVIMGVGGLFDFYSGNIQRAPLWMREIGCEWLWRMSIEPQRLWRRYLIGNPLFLLRVMLHKGEI